MTPRTPVAVILAIAAAVSLVLLVGAALVTAARSPAGGDLSPNYSAVINSTLGVLIGSLATWVGATAPKRRGPNGNGNGNGHTPSAPPPRWQTPPAEAELPYRPTTGGQQ